MAHDPNRGCNVDQRDAYAAISNCILYNLHQKAGQYDLPIPRETFENFKFTLNDNCSVSALLGHSAFKLMLDRVMTAHYDGPPARMMKVRDSAAIDLVPAF